MKKIITIILALVVILSLCACTSTPKETPSPAIPDSVDMANPMFVDVGSTIIIDGVEWNASCMCYNKNTDSIVSNDIHSYFIVNRVNMHVFYVYRGIGQSGTAYAMDTGLIYDGPLVVDGTSTVVPAN